MAFGDMLEGETFKQWLDRKTEERMEEESIKCPHCGYYEYRPDGHHDYEGLEDLITCCGSQDGPIEVQCNNCDKVFLVEELVTRSYEITRPEEEEDAT